MNLRRALPMLLAALAVLAAPGTLPAQDALPAALPHAAATGDGAAIRRLLAAGIAVDARDAAGRTALMAAAGAGNVELVRLLLYRGAARAAVSPDGDTAADMAHRANFLELAALLEPAERARTAPAASSVQPPPAVAVLSPVAPVAALLPPAAPTAAKRASGAEPARPVDMDELWRSMALTVRPDVLLRLSAEFARSFPDSPHGEANRRIAVGAGQALAALRSARLSLAVLAEASGDAAYRDALAEAARGNREAALRLATMYRAGSHGLPEDARRSEQWLQVAAELGSGEASWRLAEDFNRAGQVGEAARFEAKAREEGYRLPPRLPSRARNF